LVTDQPLRGALLGAGHVTEFHLEAWSRIPKATITTVVDPNLDKAKRRASEYGIQQYYRSLEDLLNAGTCLDFIDIAAPPDAHLDLVTIAAKHKLHILCQKPFAPDLAQAREMMAICRHAGVLLSINENWRWRAWYREVKALLNAGIIGTPVYASFFLHNSSWLFPREELFGHRFLTWPRVIMYDMGIHYIDITRFLFGEIESVYARMANLSPLLKGEDRTLAVLGRDGFSAIIDLSWTSYAPRGYPDRHNHVLEEFRVEGERGTLELLPDREKGDHMVITTNSGKVVKKVYQGDPFKAYKDSYRASQQHFIDSLIEGKLPETHAEDNLKTLALTLAAYEAVSTNQVVEIARFLEL
jgi:D-apiose dehydrogenase